MTDVTVTLHLHGAFKKYQDIVMLSVPAGSTLKAVAAGLVRVLGPQTRDLVNDSAIANDRSILPADFVIKEDADLFILPPVCGG